MLVVSAHGREYYEFDVEKACDTESEVELNLLSESDASSSGSVNRGGWIHHSPWLLFCDALKARCVASLVQLLVSWIGSLFVQW